LLIALRRLLIILGIVGVVGIAFCGSMMYFVFREYAALPNTCDPKTPKNTEELGQFKFPPSMRSLSSSCWGMQGWGGSAQFEMASSDLDYFVSHSRIKPPLVSKGVPVDSLLATSASTMKSYLYGSYRTVYQSGKSFWQDILIDTSNSTWFVVTVIFSGG
jgi:hypothetical protein